MRQQETALEQLRRQKLLLQLEYYTEKEAFRKQTETMGLRRKVKRGDAWFPIRVGKSYYNSLNQLVVEVFRGEEEDVDHNFEFGRPVVFLSATDAKDLGGKLRYFSFTATVSYVDGNRMVVAVPDSAPLLELQSSSQPLGVQLSFDETSYRAMFQALDRVIAAKNDRLAYLRELFHGDRQPQRYAFEPIRFPWLNPTQEQAVNEVLRAKDVAIVHGPPGTGKTTTLVEAINETLMRESQVMVCAQSNMAVDWISEKLVDRGINVLRIGNPTRVNDKMLGFTYERRFESHPDYPQLWAIRKAIRELRQHRKRGSGLLDTAAPCLPGDIGGRPLPVAAHGEEPCRPEGRSWRDAHGARYRHPTKCGHPAQGAISHERGHHALLQRLVLRRPGEERTASEAQGHTGL